LDPDKTGKFNIHIKWISFRVGLDWNQVVIHGIEWRNPPGFNSGKHEFLLRIDEVSLAIDALSVYKAVTTDASIHINSFVISDVDIHIKRHLNNERDAADDDSKKGEGHLKLRSGVLNFSAAIGAVDEGQERSMLEKIEDNLSDAMGSSQYIMQAVAKCNPFTVIKMTAAYIGKSFRNVLRKSSDLLQSQKMIAGMMNVYKSEEELQALFLKYDKDGSGFLDKDELREVLCESIGTTITEGEVDLILSMFDSSGDGNISYEEFLWWWKNKDKRGVDMKEANEASSQADEYFKHKHKSTLFGIHYKFEIDNLQITQFGAVLFVLCATASQLIECPV